MIERLGLFVSLVALIPSLTLADGLPTKIGRTNCREYVTNANSIFGVNNDVDEKYHDALTWIEGYVLATGPAKGSLIDGFKKNNADLPVMVMEWAVIYCKNHPNNSLQDAGDYMLYFK